MDRTVHSTPFNRHITLHHRPFHVLVPHNTLVCRVHIPDISTEQTASIFELHTPSLPMKNFQNANLTLCSLAVLERPDTPNVSCLVAS